MEALAFWTGRALAALLLGLAITIAAKLFTGGIRLRGLLLDTTRRREFSPARVQLLLFTLAAAGQYITLMMRRPEDSGLPALPGALVQFLGASQAVYAGGKAWQIILVPLLSKLRKGTP